MRYGAAHAHLAGRRASFHSHRAENQVRIVLQRLGVVLDETSHIGVWRVVRGGARRKRRGIVSTVDGPGRRAGHRSSGRDECKCREGIRNDGLHGHCHRSKDRMGLRGTKQSKATRGRGRRRRGGGCGGQPGQVRAAVELAGCHEVLMCRTWSERTASNCI